jgi:hypothetical protein
MRRNKSLQLEGSELPQIFAVYNTKIFGSNRYEITKKSKKMWRERFTVCFIH